MKFLIKIVDCILLFLMGIACIILSIVGFIVAAPILIILMLIKGVLICSQALLDERIRDENTKRKS